MVEYVKTFPCEGCGKQASGRGHLCHPNKDALPFDCEYCAKSVDEARHVCTEMIDKIEYVCKKCGRLAAYSSLLCEPEDIGRE